MNLTMNPVRRRFCPNLPINLLKRVDSIVRCTYNIYQLRSGCESNLAMLSVSNICIMSNIEVLGEEITNECAALRIRQLNRILSGIYDEELRSYQVTIAQLDILALVSQYEAITPQVIGLELNVEKSTLSRGLERMIRNGWLKASYSPGKRLQTVTLSKKGETMLNKASKGWAEAQTRVEELLGKRHLSNLFKMAERVTSD